MRAQPRRLQIRSGPDFFEEGLPPVELPGRHQYHSVNAAHGRVEGIQRQRCIALREGICECAPREIGKEQSLVRPRTLWL